MTRDEMTETLTNEDFAAVVGSVERGEIDDLESWLWPVLRDSYSRLSEADLLVIFHGRGGLK